MIDNMFENEGLNPLPDNEFDLLNAEQSSSLPPLEASAEFSQAQSFQQTPAVDPPVKKPAAKPLTYEQASKMLDQMGAKQNKYYGSDITEASYVPYEQTRRYVDDQFGYLPGIDNEDFRAQQQSWFSKAASGAAKLPAYTLTKLGSGVGFTLGLVNPENWFAKDGVISAAADNGISNFFNSVEEKVRDEWLPTFQEAADVEKGFFARATTDLNFWTEDVVDGAAFMASAFIPGMALSKLNLGLKLSKGISGLGIGAGAAESIIPGGGRVMNYLTNANKFKSGFDTVTTWALATGGEAMFEAKGVKDNVMASLDGKLNPLTGEIYTDDERKAIAGGAAQNTFLMNAALLGFTNAFELKYLRKVLGQSEAGVNKIIQKAPGQSFEAVGPTTRLGKLMDSNLARFGKGAAGGVVAEGLIEENTQLAIQRMNESYGMAGKIASISDYMELFPRVGRQTMDAFRGNDQEASMSIGLGGLLGGGMAAVGDVNQARRERLNTDGTVKLINAASESWLKFGDIYQKEDKVIKDASGNVIRTDKVTVFDAQGEPVLDNQKLAAAIAGFGRNLDTVKEAENLKDPNYVKYLKDSAFKDYVQAHIAAGTEDILLQNLDKAKNATPEDLVKMGFDPTGNVNEDTTRLKNLAATLIKQHKLIESDILLNDNSEEERARKNTLLNIVGNQAVINNLTKDLVSQAEQIKTDLIDFEQTSISDSVVDKINLLQYQIKQQEQTLEAIKNLPEQRTFQIEAAQNVLDELNKDLATALKDNEPTLKDLVRAKNGSYVYEKEKRRSNPVNKAYQKKLKDRAGYQNSVLMAGAAFAILADAKTGSQKFLTHIQEDIVNPVNSAADQLESETPAVVDDTPKKSQTFTLTDENGESTTLTLTVGDIYVTAADEKTVIFKNQPVKTFNNNLIEILDINGEEITIKFNNKSTHTIPVERLGKAGKLWNLKDMSPEQRIYFKNRDLKLTINVSAKFGKPHKIDGVHASKDYSKTGIFVPSKLKLEQNKDKEWILKIAYVNPVNQKQETFEYSSEYLKKYENKAGRLDLRTLPGEMEYQAQQRKQRKDNNLIRQQEAIVTVIKDAENKLTQTQEASVKINQQLTDLQTELSEIKEELELVAEELAANPYTKGRKSAYRKQLEQLKNTLPAQISSKEELLLSLQLEKEALEQTYKALTEARDFYYEALDDIEVNNEPFDSGEGTNLSSEVENLRDERLAEFGNPIQTDRELEEMLTATQAEISYLDSTITSLKSYISDLKELVFKTDLLGEFADNLEAFSDFNGVSSFRKYLRGKIAQSTDPVEKDKLQELMKRVLKSGKEGDALSFWISDFNDTVRKIEKYTTDLQNAQQDLLKISAGINNRAEIKDFQTKITFLNKVQDTIIQGVNLIKAQQPFQQTAVAVKAKTVAIAKELAEYDKIMSSEPVDNETDASAPIFFGDFARPVLSLPAMFKTAGRHMDNNDKEVNSPQDGRFFKFTSEKAHDGIYQLQAITNEADDVFGIRTTQIGDVAFPDDIKLIVVQKQADGSYRPVGVDGKVLENPTADTLVYSSMVGDPTLLNGTDAEVIAYLKTEGGPFVTKELDNNEILDIVKQFRTKRAEVIKKAAAGESVYFDVTEVSYGIQNKEPLITTVNSEGQVVKTPQELPLENRLLAENTTDWVNMKHPDGTSIELEVVTTGSVLNKKVKAGRLVLVKKGNVHDSVIQVYNRKMTTPEQDNLVNILKFIAPLMGRRKINAARIDQLNELLEKKTITPEQHKKLITPLTAEETANFDDAIKYLMNVVHWRQPKDSNDIKGDQFYVSKGKLVRVIRTKNADNTFSYNKLEIPFDENAIEQNRVALSENLYHAVNNKAVKNNTEPFTELFIDEFNDINKKIYSNYTEFLLSSKGGRTPVVYTNIVEYSPESTNPQLKSVYLKFSLKDEEQSPTGVNKTVLPEDIEKLITTGVVQFVDDETGEVCS
jgi:hypothetical protein